MISNSQKQRNFRSEVSCKESVLKSTAKFTGTHWCLFLMKLQARSATLLKRDSSKGVTLSILQNF